MSSPENQPTSSGESASLTRHLPFELLSEIFLWLLDLWDEEVALCEGCKHSTIHPNVAQLVLTHVCRRWRQATLNLASFWTRYYHLEHVGSPKSADQAEAMKMWMQRAGDARPMNITIHSLSRSLRPVFQNMGNYATRVVSLHLLLGVPDAIAFSLLNASLMTKLEKVTIVTMRTFYTGPDWGLGLDPLPMLQNAISLKHASFETFAMLGDLPRLPWSQLQSLSLKAHVGPFNLDTTAVLNILQHCQSLRSFSLIMLNIHTAYRVTSTTDAFMQSPVVHVTHPSLRTLVLSTDRTRNGHEIAKVDLSELLTCLTAPNLHSLEYRWIHCEEFKALESFLHRSSSQLKSLNLLPADFVKDSPLLIFEELPPLPHLEELSIPSSVDESFTDALVIEESSPILCPNLRRISIQVKQRISAKALMSIFRSRTYDIPEGARVARLEFIDLIYFRGRKRHIPKAELCRMQEAGTLVIARRK